MWRSHLNGLGCMLRIAPTSVMAASIILKRENNLLKMFPHLKLSTAKSISPVLFSNSLVNVLTRNLTTSSINFVKKIEETTNGNITIIEGIIKDSDRKDKLIPLESGDACVLCKLNLPLRHTDVLILSQFIRPDGRMLSRRVTGLCGLQQKILTSLVIQAKKAGLISNLNPPQWRKDPARNRYFVPGLDGNVTKRFK